jgi:hypothetical protein
MPDIMLSGMNEKPKKPTKKKTAKKKAPVKLDVSATVMANVFGIDRATTYRWRDDGMPVKKNGTFNIPECVQWKLEKDEACRLAQGNVKDKKTAMEIELLSIKHEKEKGAVISRSEAKSIECARGRALKLYLQNNMPANAHLFVDKPIEELRILLEQFAKKLMDVWVGADRSPVDLNEPS